MAEGDAVTQVAPTDELMRLLQSQGVQATPENMSRMMSGMMSQAPEPQVVPVAPPIAPGTPRATAPTVRASTMPNSRQQMEGASDVGGGEGGGGGGGGGGSPNAPAASSEMPWMEILTALAAGGGAGYLASRGRGGPGAPQSPVPPTGGPQHSPVPPGSPAAKGGAPPMAGGAPRATTGVGSAPPPMGGGPVPPTAPTAAAKIVDANGLRQLAAQMGAPPGAVDPALLTMLDNTDLTTLAPNQRALVQQAIDDAVSKLQMTIPQPPTGASTVDPLAIPEPPPGAKTTTGPSNARANAIKSRIPGGGRMPPRIPR